jgi:uncharacterized membrane protein YphA (DoxX/SURF4 family)
MVNIKKNQDLGLLILRLAVGVIFIAHGWAKFSGMEDTIAFFAQLGMPALFAYVVAAIELVAGIALVVGIYTDLAALLIAGIMTVALVYVKMVTFKLGLLGGYELDLILLAAALTIMFVGPGKHVAMKLKSS